MAKEPIKAITRDDTLSIGAGTGTDSITIGTGQDSVVAQTGTAAQAAQAAEKPVVLGAAPVPVEPGGPGVGAARIAEEAPGTVSRPLTPADAADMGLRGPLNEAEREELARLRTAPSEREELEVLRRLRGTGVVVDAAVVTGQRFAVPATAIKRDGVLYGPDAPDEAHRRVPVDFAAYTELVGIGAILSTPFHELEPADAE